MASRKMCDHEIVTLAGFLWAQEQELMVWCMLVVKVCDLGMRLPLLTP